ncbi:MAG: hypothetical protein LBK06_05100 [Planctomycetaceae bacterium]|nr:hypothetical protein [Planctomycetaceae bacterium]
MFKYAEAVFKFKELNTAAQQHGAVVQGRSLSPYRLPYRYRLLCGLFFSSCQRKKFF